MDYNFLKTEDKITKTAYEWCLDFKIRVMDLNEWPLKWYDSKEKHYFQFPLLEEAEFLNALKSCKVKYNSTPRKTPYFLEYRMYGLVPYNISEIQKGIQFGHAVVEYSQNACGISGLFELYNKWAKYDKTFIILNGGTTNENVDNKWYGSLQKHRDTLKENDVLISEFREPDLNNTLTAVVFLVDERVWNRDLYGNFEKETPPYSRTKPSENVIKELGEKNQLNYEKWVEKVGGPKNAFLREFLSQFKLA